MRLHVRGCHQDIVAVSGIKEVVVVVLLPPVTSCFHVWMTRALETGSSASWKAKLVIINQSMCWNKSISKQVQTEEELVIYWCFFRRGAARGPSWSVRSPAPNAWTNANIIENHRTTKMVFEHTVIQCAIIHLVRKKDTVATFPVSSMNP